MHPPSHPRLRTALAFAAVALAAGGAAAHTVDCTGRSGIDLARCDRHQRMAGRCAAEAAAIQRCEPQARRDFLRCVSDTLKASPMGGS